MGEKGFTPPQTKNMLLVLPVTLKNELKVTHGVPVGISSRRNWHTDSKELDLIIKP